MHPYARSNMEATHTLMLIINTPAKKVAILEGAYSLVNAALVRLNQK
jgi:hypothetical protein